MSDMSKHRRFSLGAILSVSTGVLLCEMGDLYRILNYMTGESLYTHQLPRACAIAKPCNLTQHPDLAEIDVNNITRENWRQWLATQTRRFGATRNVSPLPIGTYRAQDPIEELIEMRGGTDGIIVVKAHE